VENNAESARWFASLTMTVVFSVFGASEQRRASPKTHVILTGGRDLTVFHGDISEMVRFTHHDSGFQCLDKEASCCGSTQSQRDGSLHSP
jgi:hypothetical protein